MNAYMNNTNFLCFALPDIGEEEIAEVIDSIRSGWLTTGPKAKCFEMNFAEFISGGVEAVAVNSATAGLHLALEAIGIGKNDEVITTPYTFTATAEVIRYLGANPVFVDIDKDSLNIDTSQIEKVITSRTKAIIPVHFAGLACDMDTIIALAKKYKLKVIEDAAHSLPTTYRGSLVGALDTDATVFSFYASKTITTGEGGMIVSRNSDIIKRCKVMRLHGINRDAFDRYTATKPSWFYEVIAPGFKYNLTDLAASLGIQQLKKVWAFQEKRAKMAAYYDECFSDAPILLPPKAQEGDIHSWHLYTIRFRQEVSIMRDKFIELMAERGIGCSVHFIPLHLQPYWRDTYGLKPGDFPNALATYERIVSLPLYTKMTTKDQACVVRAVRDILKNYDAAHEE